MGHPKWWACPRNLNTPLARSSAMQATSCDSDSVGLGRPAFETVHEAAVEVLRFRPWFVDVAVLHGHGPKRLHRRFRQIAALVHRRDGRIVRAGSIGLRELQLIHEDLDRFVAI